MDVVLDLFKNDPDVRSVIQGILDEGEEEARQLSEANDDCFTSYTEGDYCVITHKNPNSVRPARLLLKGIAAPDNSTTSGRRRMDVCDGVQYGDGCWFLGTSGQSCSDVCGSTANTKFYDPNTQTIAGHSCASNCVGQVTPQRRQESCLTIMQALDAENNLGAWGGVAGAPDDTTDAALGFSSGGSGCHARGVSMEIQIHSSSPTNENGKHPDAQRACACLESQV